MTIEHAYLLRGYALGQNAPQAVLDSVDALIARFTTIQPAPVEERRAPVEAPTEPLPQHVQQEQAPAPKKKHNWSPEARARQSQRMRERQAAGLMTRRKPEPTTPGEAPAPSQGGA
jgi:hypothetical protein